MSSYTLGFISIFYLGFLFLLATIAEWRGSRKKSLINNPYVYSLSLAIYCTGWTYYGSVGRVTTNGLDFLAVYLGPTIMMFFGWGILRKIIRICKIQRITSIADFISTRYGKSSSLGVLVTLVSLLAGVPYIGLQIKAIASSFSILTNKTQHSLGLFNDQAFYIVIILMIFTILFGTRKIEADEKHEGMVFSIATESLVKLIGFLAVGFYVVFYLFKGFDDIVLQVPTKEIAKIFSIQKGVGYNNWFWHILLSAGAFLLLPRQFQVGVIENNNEKHLAQALWLFPLYMLLINIFVVPLALAGEIIFANEKIASDMFVLGLPLKYSNTWLALLVYIGGFSAATGMIIVETIAISMMVSNNLFMPLLLQNAQMKERITRNPIFYLQSYRRVAIVIIIFLGFLYYKYFSEKYSLVSIGMVAFVAIIQFAPSTFGGIFWKRGNKKGAIAGLVAGILIWFMFLILPSLNEVGMIQQVAGLEQSIVKHFVIADLDSISNAVFWSLFFNIGLYFILSILTNQTSLEHNQAVLFVDVFAYSTTYESAVVWKGSAQITDITLLLSSFIGEVKSRRLLNIFATNNKINLKSRFADPLVVNYVEKILAGIIGNTSARMMVSSVAKEEPISIEEVVNILKQSQELIATNNELKEKSDALKILTEELKNSNEKLVQIDQLKDDFLTTVTHEIRTPLTSIKALSEILFDNEELETEERKHFLETIINESDRMGRLINQVLDLEKYESGKRKLRTENIRIDAWVQSVMATLEPLVKEKKIKLIKEIDTELTYLVADRDKMTQMLINLVSNSIKFVPAEYGKISVKVSKKADSMIVEIQDNGPGIAPEFQELIFNKFYQAENQNIRKPKGTGLGLAITKKIVDLHNGQIVVKSELGEGAIFTVTLPLNREKE